MARHTSLYQAPRSPLIQGRTRWQRPLWQAWLGGCAVGAALLAGAYFVLAARGLPPWFGPGLVWLLVAVVAGSAAGAMMASMAGWRQRWFGAALLSAAGLGIAALVLSAVFGR